MFLKELLFPKFCLGCGLPGTYICPRCQRDFQNVKPFRCLYCNNTSLYGLTHSSCTKKLYIDGTISIFRYNNIMKKVIKNIKYRLATDVWNEFIKTVNPLAIEPLGFYKKLSGKIYIQPVPLSINKIRDRGFNQALLISKFFQKFLDIPISDFLLRIKDTLPQAEIKTKRDRYNNVRGAFKIKNKHSLSINGSKVILVDDVITTGSTVKEPAKILKKAGALKVYVLTLAKG